MDCKEFVALLDQYTDGQAMPDGFDAHAAHCESCRCALKAAETIRDLFGRLDEEVPVPLDVQAKWRSAIRREAVAKKRNTWLRVGAVAAALALTVGVFGLTQKEAAPVPAVLEADGMQIVAGEEPDAFAAGAYTPIRLAGAMQSQDALLDLVAEYEGTVDSVTDGSVCCMLPGYAASDFITALGALGIVSDAPAEFGETAALCIVLSEE